MKKLNFFIVLTLFFLIFSGLTINANAGVPAANHSPEIQNFHAVFGNGYFSAVARIYDADNDLQSFDIGAVYGVKFTGEKIQIGDGCGYTCGDNLRPQGNGQYSFLVMYASQKIVSDLIYIIIVGQASDAAGNTAVKKIRAYPADFIPVFRRYQLKQPKQPARSQLRLHKIF